VGENLHSIERDPDGDRHRDQQPGDHHDELLRHRPGAQHRGVDRAECPSGSSNNESTPWTPIETAGCPSGATRTLAPASQTLPVDLTATVTATLSACGTRLPGATVDFAVTWGPNPGVGGPGSTTDASGASSFSYSSTSAGSDTVDASVTTAVGPLTSDSVTVDWTAPFLTRGAFVIADSQAGEGTAVTFCGAQWARDNVPSQGPAPRSCKGFAGTPSSPPACGGMWSSRTGNSTAPPPGPLPQYMP